MAKIKDRYDDLNKDLCVLDRQHQDAHDIRLIQTYDFWRHHTTPDTGIHVPKPTQSMYTHLIDTINATAVLVTTINRPHSTDSTYITYDNKTSTLPPNPVFQITDTTTDICHKYTNSHLVNISTIKILRQAKRQLINTIARKLTDTTNHEINTSQQRRACQVTRLDILSAPQLCIVPTHP